MSFIGDYLHVKHKVMFSLAIFSKTAKVFIVVIFNKSSCVIEYSKLESFFAELAVYWKL
jgi:hypothetical protein